MDYIESFRNFVVENLPPHKGIPYLVMTPAWPGRSRCLFLARSLKDPIHTGVVISDEAQAKLTAYFNSCKLDKEGRNKLYQEYIDSIEDVTGTGYVLQHIANVKGGVTKQPHLMVSFIRGTHQYSFYL